MRETVSLYHTANCIFGTKNPIILKEVQRGSYAFLKLLPAK
jgi:hypothetical protein